MLALREPDDAPRYSAGTGPALSAAVFADGDISGRSLCEDAEAAGLRILPGGSLRSLAEDDQVHPLGDVLLIDCPAAGPAELAALSRLDARAAHSGSRLIVLTTVAALEGVFGCLDQSEPQILVDAHRAERIIAIGRALGQLSGSRLRELNEEDRLVLLRLTEQVGKIGERLDRLESPLRQLYEGSSGSAFRFESPKQDFDGAKDAGSERLVRAVRPALPDSRLVRRIIRQRQLRARHFPGDLFADPAWDMLLDLTAARVEHTRVSITSLCIASAVPPTTALRWITQMIEAGLFVRVEDEVDRRRAFIALTDKAVDAMARYFAEIGSAAKHLV